MTRILLIDDEETCREVTTIALRAMGFSDVVTAEDGKQALKLLNQMSAAPDVVIADIYMPHKDGVEIIASLVERQYAGALVLMSGADPSILRIAQMMAVDSGIHVLASLLKPLDDSALRLALEPVINGSFPNAAL